jgi:hypothetical protein
MAAQILAHLRRKAKLCTLSLSGWFSVDQLARMLPRLITSLHLAISALMNSPHFARLLPLGTACWTWRSRET